MSLDRDYVILQNALDISREHYDKNTFEHALRVMNFVARDEMIPQQYKNDCECLALMHDLLEDTDYKPNELPKNFNKALALLTKPDGMSYDEYCMRINEYKNTKYGKCAWYVKLADIKDHLNQVKTLTPSLKEKYLSGLRYLL